MMKKAICSFVLYILLTACNGIQVSEKLNLIDSLIIREQYDSAGVLLNEVREVSLTEDDRAHYYLQKTQLGYLTNQPLSSDSLLDEAITYYNNVGNQKKLADAYYYKSFRSRTNQDYPQAIPYCKEAERLALNINDMRLQFKIAENLSFLNALCGNYQLQLQYAKNSLALAQKVKNNNWIAYSYNKVCFAFANLERYDSALFYAQKTIPYVKYVEDSDKAIFLTNIGAFYKENNLNKAKELLEKALVYDKLPLTYEHLADVYYTEGNKEKAYTLWKQALSKNGGINYDKSNLIQNILAYDLERGNLDEASKNLDKIIAIKDSMLYLLRNDTIKDLQLRFDHEVAMHEADKKLISTQRILLGLVFILGSMAFYIFFRKIKEEALRREHQMQLYAYTTEIDQLKANKEKNMVQLEELESHKEKDGQRIKKLEEDVKNAEQALEKLNKKIKELLDDKSPKLKQGRMLYDHIIGGGTAVNWNYKEETLFNYYYAATHYQSYNRLKKVERVAKLSAHNMFYLILKDMGRDDGEIRRIMALSPEGLRSLRNRTKPKEYYQ